MGPRRDWPRACDAPLPTSSRHSSPGSCSGSIAIPIRRGGGTPEQLVNGVLLGATYALFALGFTLMFGVLGVINLSHGSFYMLGAYLALTFTGIFGDVFLALALGMAFVVVVVRSWKNKPTPRLADGIVVFGGKYRFALVAAVLGGTRILYTAAEGLFHTRT